MGIKKHILITGRPGVGKTTLLLRIKDFMVENGVSVGGLFCPEIKNHNKRVGFALIDIMTGQQGVLALKNSPGPKVGNYGVNIKDLESIGVSALKNALNSAEYILIDEIAPMELKSPFFSQILEKVFCSSKRVIAVIHKKSNNDIIKNIKDRDDVILFDINQNNRDLIYDEIVEKLDLNIIRSSRFKNMNL